jgi:hypothetical protein
LSPPQVLPRVNQITKLIILTIFCCLLLTKFLEKTTARQKFVPKSTFRFLALFRHARYDQEIAMIEA